MCGLLRNCHTGSLGGGGGKGGENEGKGEGDKEGEQTVERRKYNEEKEG